MNRSFWKNRRVFLTGHTGFKGSWLSLWLHMLEANVTGYALDPPTQPNLFQQANVANTVRSIRGDIRDYASLHTALRESRPEIILHLAAQSIVRRGYEDPIETYSSNVMGTVHLLEAVRQLDRECLVVNVTSDKCYRNNEWLWGYRETDALGGHDPYSNSKACAELVTSAFCDSYFRADAAGASKIAVATARAMLSAAGTGPGINCFPISCELLSTRSPVLSAARSPFGHGNSFSSRCTVTCSLQKTSQKIPRASPDRGILAPRTPTPNP